MEGSGLVLFRGTITAFAWRKREIHEGIARVPAEVRTGHLPNISEKHHRSSQLARQLYSR
jgi:hypothetical protein